MEKLSCLYLNCKDKLRDQDVGNERFLETFFLLNNLNVKDLLINTFICHCYRFVFSALRSVHHSLYKNKTKESTDS